jgi:hypothetical protein
MHGLVEMARCIFRYLVGDCRDTSNRFYEKRGIACTQAAESQDSRLQPRVGNVIKQNEPNAAGGANKTAVVASS